MSAAASQSCCCVSCLYFSDDFNRADSTTIGSDWTETTGDWEISSGTLTTSSADARLTHSTGYTSTGRQKTTVKIKGSAGDVVKIYYGRRTNGFVDIEFGSPGKIRIVSGATVFSECDLDAAADTWHTVELYQYNVECEDKTNTNDSISGVVVVNGSPAGLFRGLTFNSNLVPVLGTEGTPSGPVYFDDFSVESTFSVPGDPGNESCFHKPLPCWPNNAGLDTLPDEAEVIVTGHSCGALNTTYVLSRGTCLTEAYELTGLSLVCGANTISRAIIRLLESGGSCAPTFILYRDTGTQHASWTLTIANGSADWCDNTITLTGASGTAAVTI